MTMTTTITIWGDNPLYKTLISKGTCDSHGNNYGHPDPDHNWLDAHLDGDNVIFTTGMVNDYGSNWSNDDEWHVRLSDLPYRRYKQLMNLFNL